MGIEYRTIAFPGGQAEWFLVPWDSEIMGFSVGQISNLTVGGRVSTAAASVLLDTFRHAGVRLVSARLPLGDLRPSMLLEEVGFRFVEVTYQPVFADLAPWSADEATGIDVIPADKELLPTVEDMAGRAFRNERFHVDSRLPSGAGDQRYRYWVRSAIDHPTQVLYILREKKVPIGFFITENRDPHEVYWHLTAIAPEYQGRGYGLRAWKKMMRLHQEAGQTRIVTTITARNLAVVNLYAKLGFRFTRPEMSLHWWAGETV